MKLVTELRERLQSTLHTDVNEFNTPSRDWCRAMQRYQHTYQMLVTEERERFKLRLLMSKGGEALVSDEEYELALKDLALEALGTLPADVLLKEIERRGMLQAAPEDDDDAH